MALDKNTLRDLILSNLTGFNYVTPAKDSTLWNYNFIDSISKSFVDYSIINVQTEGSHSGIHVHTITCSNQDTLLTGLETDLTSYLFDYTSVGRDLTTWLLYLLTSLKTAFIVWVTSGTTTAANGGSGGAVSHNHNYVKPVDNIFNTNLLSTLTGFGFNQATAPFLIIFAQAVETALQTHYDGQTLTNASTGTQHIFQ